MTPPPRTHIRIGQIWQRRAGGQHVRIATHNTRHGVVRLEPLTAGRPSHAMEITLRRNYTLVKDADQT